jgi:hypothetical protein
MSFSEPEEKDVLPEVEARVAELLVREKPLPSPGFRGMLGRHLARRDPGYGPRPAWLRLRAAGCIATGIALLVIGALQAGGAL